MLSARLRLVVSAVAVVVVGVFVSLAYAWSWPPFSASANARARAPERVKEVPTTLPEAGVVVDNIYVLRPPAMPSGGTITEAEAIRAARAYGKSPLPPDALEASVTEPGSIPPPGTPASERAAARPIVNVPAWVVTFTSRKPFYPSPNPGGPAATHFSVVLNATTGKMFLGFFTK